MRLPFLLLCAGRDAAIAGLPASMPEQSPDDETPKKKRCIPDKSLFYSSCVYPSIIL